MEGRPSLYLIRHARSTWNDRAIALQAAGESVKGHPERWNLAYLDAPLCPVGIQQALDGRAAAHAVSFSKVFVSPMRRALETAKILFEGHPSNPKLIVHPVLTERLNNANDLPNWEGVPYEGFEHFDWSLMPSHWYPFDLVDNEYFREAKGKPNSEVYEILMRRAAELYPVKIESRAEALVRVNKAKAIWSAELAQSSGSIGLVAHSYYYRLFTFKETPEGSTYKQLENCEIYRVEDFS
mmetsp:Transcript_6853/g.12450  ORF Transcript_6853/g.12450 Transcript_6853/m.12450 type:complete len:239 (+) Transcript_6853:3469-4185(+)